ncbi:MAG: hypothetical protein AAF791_02870 [Bacteroidota bacterium]
MTAEDRYASALDSLDWEDDVLEVETQGDPLRLRYSFANVKAFDRAARRSGDARFLEVATTGFGPGEAASFLRFFAEDEAGQRLFKTDAEAWNGVTGAGFVHVRAAYDKVFSRLAAEMGFGPAEESGEQDAASVEDDEDDDGEGGNADGASRPET